MNSIQYNYFNPEQIILLEKRVFNNVIKFPCSYAHKASFRSGLIFETPYMYSPFGLEVNKVKSFNDVESYIRSAIYHVYKTFPQEEIGELLNKIKEKI